MKKLRVILLIVILTLALTAVISGCVNDSIDGTGVREHNAHTVGDNGTQPVVFAAWDGTPITADGIYNLYLQSDLNCKNQIVFGDVKQKRDITVNLCLNGHNWYSAGRAGYIADGVTLNICNCSGKTSVITGNGDDNSRQGGTFLVGSNGKLNVHEGIHVTAENDDGSVTNGGVVYVKGYLGIYGATFSGVDTPRATKDDGETVDITTGWGGTIGVAGSAELYMKSGVITGGTAFIGGNVHLATDALFTMEGGEITAGVSKTYILNSTSVGGGNGGGVFVEGGTFIMKGDAKIYGNRCSGKGGAVILNGEATMEIWDNATIAHNISGISGGAGIHVNVDTCKLTVGGSANVEDNRTSNGICNVYLADATVSITIGHDLTDTASIGVTTDDTGIRTVTNVAAPVAAFASDSPRFEIIASADGTLALKPLD